MAYEPQFTKPYPDGWQDLPAETTPISAEVMDGYDAAIEVVEEQLQKTTEIYDDTSVTPGRRADTEKAENSANLGCNNLCTAANAIVAGTGNDVEAQNAVVLGLVNKVPSGSPVYVFGYSNTAEGGFDQSVCVGRENLVNCAGSVVVGVGLKGVLGYGVANILGKYNNPVAKPFVLGGGTSDTDRKNFIEIDSEGNVLLIGDVTNGEGQSLGGLALKINLPVDEDGNPIYGTSGQVLQTNGDGTMEWVDQSGGDAGGMLWYPTVDEAGNISWEQSDVQEAPEVVNIKGASGVDGQDGTDGISPTVEITKEGKVTTIVITDVNGPHTATINDGENGAAGGAYSEEDKAELEAYIDEKFATLTSDILGGAS